MLFLILSHTSITLCHTTRTETISSAQKEWMTVSLCPQQTNNTSVNVCEMKLRHVMSAGDRDEIIPNM